MNNDDEDTIGFDFLEAFEDAKKCECGADKTGQPGHSFWCPKYVDPNTPKKESKS